MKTILIITGGTISQNMMAWVTKQQSISMIIAVDKGLEVCHEFNLTPDLIIGDYDTVDVALLDKYKTKIGRVYTYPPEKDYTDTHLAISKALEYLPEEIVILGGTGGRMDHTIANIGLLMLCASKNCKGYIIDDHNRITITHKDVFISRELQYGKYVSLLPYGDKVVGITLEGFKYPLHDAVLHYGESVGISNEIIEDVGYIHIKKGYLVVIESKD